MNTTHILSLTSILVSSFAGPFAAGAAADEPCPAWSPAFGLPGTDDAVRAFASFDDGSGPALYAGGSFTAAGGAAAHHVARWNGTSWSPVGNGFDGDVMCLAVLDDGSGPALYAGGRFTFSALTQVNGVARWNGTSWTALGGGVTGGAPNGVHALCTFDDGTGVAIFAGGRFTHADGVFSRGIARWKNGTWSNVGTGVGNLSSIVNTDVNALCVYDEGSGPVLFVAGYFNSAGGEPISGIARWSGAHWSPVGSSVNLVGYALTVWDSGAGPELYVGMSSGQAGGFDMEGIARWNGAWTPVGFGLGQAGGPHGLAYALSVFDDGSGEALYAGGSFALADGLPAHNFARFDGAQWTSLASSLAGSVRALAVHEESAGESLFLGGDFLSVDGNVSLRVSRRNAGGYSALGGGHGISGQVSAITSFDAGAGPRVIVGGKYSAAGSTLANNIAAYDGATWTPLGTGTSDRVESLAVFDEGAGPVLFAGGGFSSAGGTVVNHLARWNGSTWTPVSGGTNYDVTSLTVFDDGSGPALYVAGPFTSAGGGAVIGNIARWNGTAWSSVGTPPSDGVYGLTVFDDGGGAALYAYSNWYTTSPPAYHSKVYKFDGSAWTQIGAEFDRFLGALHVHPTGGVPTLYAGVNAVGSNSLARWDGTRWIMIPGLDNGPNYPVIVRAMATFDEGLGNAPTLVVAGAFATAGGLPAVNLARFDGTQWHAFDGNFGTEIETAGVYALHVVQLPSSSSPTLFAGGPFAPGLGAPSIGVAERVSCAGPISAYCFGDGSLTTPCPCANYGAAGHGCANSSVPAGALLSGSGLPSLAADTFVLEQSDSLDHAFTIVLQGNGNVAGGTAFGDGLRCAGGSLKRLYIVSAVGGTIVVPGPGDPSISARSAALGDPLVAGSVRNYQAYYRDPVLTFCPEPGKAFNVGNGVRAVWAP